MNNPPVRDCGFPDGGNITQSVTYTLTADCVPSQDVVVTNGAEVTIINNGFRFMIMVTSGKVTVIGGDGSRTETTSGRVSSGSGQGQTGVQTCFQRLGAIGLICRVSIPETVLEIYDITPDSEGHFLLRVTQTQVDAVRRVTSSPARRMAALLFAMGRRQHHHLYGPQSRGQGAPRPL